jgi:acetate---CoA ligase (ADP-forming) subunit beta
MHRTIAKARSEQRHLLETEAEELFAEHGLPVPPFRLATSEAEAVAAARGFGFPVVLKIVSPDILHKSDAGGVKVGLADAAAVSVAYNELMTAVRGHAAAARIEGVLVAASAPPGLECIVGMTRDPQFGPALMFGLGGVFVELLKDVSFRVLPILRSDAEEMVREIRGWPLLQGLRGSGPRDVPAVVDFLVKTAELVGKNPEIREIDVNPLRVYERGVLALDVRVIL